MVTSKGLWKRTSPAASGPKGFRLRLPLRFRRAASTPEFVPETVGDFPLVTSRGASAVKPKKPVVSCKKHVKQYCEVTSIHGLRYITEEKRHACERVFWIIWCLFGASGAMYLMSKIWQRWESSPVITSVDSTNYPVNNLAFPAVTICTVNKAVNEKLIIQGCRANYTLNQMKGIIGGLVDPESRNNDQATDDLKITAEKALKFLRMVSPKCEDFILSCRWNNKPARCYELFRMVLTDSGYCCTFNAVPSLDQGKESDESIVAKQEVEFSYLQKAVWNFTEEYMRQKMGGTAEKEKKCKDEEGMPIECPVESPNIYTCGYSYSDGLFPGICRFLTKCRRNPKACNLGEAAAPTTAPLNPKDDATTSTVKQEDFPLKAMGSGRSRGLTLMLDTLRCDSVPTDSFKGLLAYVHRPEEFPAVGEKGIMVSPGMETQVAVKATDTYSTSVLRGFSSDKRRCYFRDQFALRYYKDYSRSSCEVECENELLFHTCQCIPYYYPGNYTVCNQDQVINCVKPALESLRPDDDNSTTSEGKLPKTLTAQVLLKAPNEDKKKRSKESSCTEFCLPACNETFYDVVVSAAPFPNQQEPNMTKILRESMERHTQLGEIQYVQASISILRVFFKDSTVMRYKRDQLFTWEDFVSNVGGVLGLCMGFSLISCVECMYFFTLRYGFDTCDVRKNVGTNPDGTDDPDTEDKVITLTQEFDPFSYPPGKFLF